MSRSAIGADVGAYGGSNMGSPDAEVDIDVALVESLLSEQHPCLAGLGLEELDSG